MRIEAADWLLSPPARAVMDVLDSAGHQAFFVGGCVRNALLGASATDVDIATSARPETVMDLARAAGIKAVPTGIDHGTVTLVVEHQGFEVTTFRRDVATDGRRAVVAFSQDIAEDALRRDFTMNALYADAGGVVHDPLNGLPDLEARYVRFIEDAEARIQEDYLRALRYFRFHAWYGDPDLGMDADALAAIAGNLDGLAHLSRERIGAEILKLLSARDPAPSVAAMAKIGMLAQLLPGATVSGLPPLVHIEGERPVDPIRRLAVLGAHNPDEALRLSKSQNRILADIARAVGMSDSEAGYRYGAEIALSAALIRAASIGAPLPEDTETVIRFAERATLPVKARHLAPLEGRALGEALKAAEARWIASGFTLTKEELLG